MRTLVFMERDMTSSFVGRNEELELLNELWISDRAAFLIIYGRRRIGKTHLLTRWIKHSGNRALYWVASPVPTAQQLESFSKAIYRFANVNPPPDDFSYGSWERAFEEVATLASHDRLALILDEFTYVLQTTPGMASVLQNLWDHSLKNTNLFLVLCGSHLGMMHRDVLSYQAPLYGRITNQIHLLPLSFGYTRHFFPYAADERVALYSIFGGIPAYWELIEPSQTLAQNIKRILLRRFNPMRDEPLTLLHDFIKQSHAYVGIFTQIGAGAHTQKEISARTKTAHTHLSQYLRNLIETGFVRKHVPVTASASSRQGRYHISDPYLRFYYRFIEPQKEEIARGVPDIALAEIRRHWQDFIGTYTWEELCREWVIYAGAYQSLPFSAYRVGSIWNKNSQVDVAGINTREKTLILGECKWWNRPAGRNVLTELVQVKTPKVVPGDGHWKVYFLGFSRTGWTDAAHQYANSVAEEDIAGDNWHSTGMRLIDLDELDADLSRWTE